jgi:hypothetical protein
MLKLITGIALGVILSLVAVWQMAGSLMFEERVSPYTVEETVARIQQNIQAAGNGWALFGLRYPTRPVEAEGHRSLQPEVFRAHPQGRQGALPVVAHAVQDFRL